MTLVVDTRGSAGDKPDNSPTFFSARKGPSTLFSLKYRALNLPIPVLHPWRYFVAAGDSLAKIEQVIAEAKTVDADLEALAKELGAESINGGYVTFQKNAEVEEVTPRIRLQYCHNEAFVCDAVAPGKFFPNLAYGYDAIRQEMDAVNARPADELEAARKALATKYKADSFDGEFFHFNDWQANIQPLPISREKQFRLKSNSAFVRGPHDGNVFSPDLETSEGLSINKRMHEITMRHYPEQRFAQWISSFELDISLSGNSESRNRPTAEAESIGGEWIIKVPVITEGIFGVDGKGGVRTGDKEGWVLPPGARAIALSEYYAKLEKFGAFRAVATTPGAA